jgi:hypothetical protein
MIQHITGVGTFVVLGIGLQIMVAVGLLTMFRKRGWL